LFKTKPEGVPTRPGKKKNQVFPNNTRMGAGGGTNRGMTDEKIRKWNKHQSGVNQGPEGGVVFRTKKGRCNWEKKKTKATQKKGRRDGRKKKGDGQPKKRSSQHPQSPKGNTKEFQKKKKKSAPRWFRKGNRQKERVKNGENARAKTEGKRAGRSNIKQKRERKKTLTQ